ncbi:hypothetical protein [[Kitasatospora] papulosa]|uniref:hypothetical protein n=1 Tax=[Kitasatospora] papulosa TaxID=1464011 RepID=UPI0036AE1E5B
MSGTNGSVARPDSEYDVLCDDVGTFLRRYTAEGGATAVTDTGLDGTTPYVPTGDVRRCEETAAASPAIDSTAQRQTGAGAVTVPAGARSVTVLVYAGAPTVAIGGGAPVPFPTGAAASWSVDRGGPAGEQLADAFVATGAAGDDFAVLTTREI